MKKIENDAPDRIVPMSYFRQNRAFGSYKMNMFMRADLIHGTDESAYKLRVYAGQENLVLADSKGGNPRTWRSVERALMFIEKHFGVVPTICLIYPQLEKEKS